MNGGTEWRVLGPGIEGDRTIAVGVEAFLDHKKRRTMLVTVFDPDSQEDDVVSIKCDTCGRRMRAARIAEYDFTASAGLGTRVLLRNVPGLRCTNGHETLTGDVVHRALFQLGVVLLGLPARLPAGAARYLRRLFGLTQAQIAAKMGVARETVAQWETGKQPISAQNDMILRTLALKSLVARGLLKPASVPDLIPGHVASDPPKPLRAPVILSDLSEAA